MRSSAGDQAEFGTRMETYRRELHVHCYRMLGSVQDADDMVQETFLRAWRRRDTVEGLSSLRAWLYTIATNVCLDALKRRPRRMVPVSARRRRRPLRSRSQRAIAEPIWLEPYPDALLQAADEQTPEEQVAAREHITMAFIVALHRLPPRQRAVLLLRDVLDWPASEVAALLDTTVPAVKSALHRARATLADHRDASDADHGALLGGHRASTARRLCARLGGRGYRGPGPPAERGCDVQHAPDPGMVSRQGDDPCPAVAHRVQRAGPGPLATAADARERPAGVWAVSPGRGPRPLQGIRDPAGDPARRFDR